MCDALGEILGMAFGSHVIKEPVICEADPVNNTPGIVAVRCVIRYPCLDTDADSNGYRDVAAVTSTLSRGGEEEEV